MEVRNKAMSLKRISRDILWYVLGNSLFVILWFIFDRDQAFWPKYILFVWTSTLLIEILRKEGLSFIASHVFFLDGAWEEKKVKELLKPYRDQHKIFLRRDRKKKLKNT